ncbi:unnamed protein product [Calypogeia fissa]
MAAVLLDGVGATSWRARSFCKFSRRSRGQSAARGVWGGEALGVHSSSKCCCAKLWVCISRRSAAVRSSGCAFLIEVLLCEALGVHFSSKCCCAKLWCAKLWCASGEAKC